MKMDQDKRLDTLFQEYRHAVPDGDGSAEFMPRLWNKIEARRSYTLSIRRFASGLVTAAAAICLLIGMLVVTPDNAMVYSATYIDALAADPADEALALVEVTSLDIDLDEGRDETY